MFGLLFPERIEMGTPPRPHCVMSRCSTAWADLAFHVPHGRTDPCPELDTGLDAVVPESHFEHRPSWLRALLATRVSVTPSVQWGGFFLPYLGYTCGGWSPDPEELYNLEQITQVSVKQG